MFIEFNRITCRQRIHISKMSSALSLMIDAGGASFSIF